MLRLKVIWGQFLTPCSTSQDFIVDDLPDITRVSKNFEGRLTKCVTINLQAFQP